MSDRVLARPQAINDVAAGMLRGAGEALSAHGDDDPLTREILLAAFAVAINRIDARLYPGFLFRARNLLWPDP